MRPFQYHAVYTLDEACSLCARYGAEGRILAGGTDLLLELRRPSQRSPKAVIDISRISELRGIKETGGTIELKPLVTHKALVDSSVIRSMAPLLAAAASAIGSPQIRNRGTLGGNIMNAAACADTVPPLMALGATVGLNSEQGSRQMALSDFFIKPYKTKALTNEILTSVSFQVPPPGSKGAFVKLGRRNALSISRLSVAAILLQDAEGLIKDARLVPGAALPVWSRMDEAESMLVGRRPSHDLFEAAGKSVAASMIALTGRRWSTEYKEGVLSVLIRRALELCTGKNSYGKV